MKHRPDPAFAAIEEWQASERATLAFEDPKKPAAARHAYARYDAAQDALCACVATTIQGLSAMLAFARDKAKERQETPFLEDYTKRAPMFAASAAKSAARLAKGGAS